MSTLAAATVPTPARASIAARRVAATNAIAEQFFTENAAAIALTCRAMSKRFAMGGRLLVCGDEAQQSDRAHVVVEFLHPVVVGKRALPAMALPDMRRGAALQTLQTIGASQDILLLLSHEGLSDAAVVLLASAHAQGITTIALTGDPSLIRAGLTASVDHAFAVPSTDQCIVQETQEMVYHVLWELVHVFLDHRTASS